LLRKAKEHLKPQKVLSPELEREDEDEDGCAGSRKHLGENKLVRINYRGLNAIGREWGLNLFHWERSQLQKGNREIARFVVKILGVKGSEGKKGSA